MMLADILRRLTAPASWQLPRPHTEPKPSQDAGDMPAHTVVDDDEEMLNADTPALLRGAGGGGDAGGPACVSESPEDDIEIQLEELQSQDEGGGGGGVGPADAARDSGCVLDALCPLKPDSQQLDSDVAKLLQTPAVPAVKSAESSSSTLLEIIPEHARHASPGEVHLYRCAGISPVIAEDPSFQPSSQVI